MIEKIKNQSSEKLLHLKALYFVRPTKENLNIIAVNLKNARFSEFYICKRTPYFFVIVIATELNQYFVDFTNSLDNSEIEKLAENDTNDLIKQIQVCFFIMITLFLIIFSLFSLLNK